MYLYITMIIYKKVLKDGYDELSDLVQQPSQENALLQSLETLKLSGE